MSKSVADLADLVLQRLGVLDAEETASDADHQFVEDAYTDLHERLTEEGLVTWDVGDVIPTGAVSPMTSILAIEVAQEFGISSQEMTLLALRAKSGRLELRRLGRGYYQPASVPIEYF